MTEVMNTLVNEAKKNRFSSIGPELSDEDVVSVWENVSSFIEKQMCQQKGVNIPGLGIFTFSQKKLDVGNNKYILIQRPVFVLSEKFAQTHQLNYTKHHVTGQVPVVQLNFSTLSFESPFPRDTVEACVKEVLQALARAVATRRNVEFTFQGIGRLQVRDSKVKMKFYKEFLNSMDGSGKLVDALKNGNETGDCSVLSEPSPVITLFSRGNSPTKICNLILPRIHQSGGLATCEEQKRRSSTGPMPPIVEEAPGAEGEVEAAEGEESKTGPAVGDEQGFKTEVLGEDRELGDVDLDLLDEGEKKENQSPQNGSRTASRLTVPVAKAMGISFHDDLLPQPSDSPKGIRGNSVMSRSAGATPMMKRSLSPINMQNGTTPRPQSLTPPGPTMSARAGSVDSLLLKKPTPLFKNPTPPIESKPGSACGHANAGQELCYLCHQRSRRNVPVSFTEERKRREEEEDRLLQQYQHMKDTESIINEHENLLAKRHESQKMAAFNLGAAEAIKCKKQARDTDFHPSYVFQKRPITPPRYLKQEKYFGELTNQVQVKDEKCKKRKADEEFLERLEQVQLAEDLALQREEYLKGKLEQTEQYKRALSAQIKVRDSLKTPDHKRIRADKQMCPPSLPTPQIILPFSETYTMQIVDGKKMLRFKPLPMPAFVPDSSEPVFGKNDMNAEKMVERRRLAHNVYKEQLETVEQKKRTAILNRIQEQKDEEQMLERSKQELLKDRSDRYERLFKNRRHLEEDWSKAREQKKSREAEDKMRFQSPALLVHEQCDKYKRCTQCKRRVGNCGESNIWRETRYIPGSRLMV